MADPIVTPPETDPYEIPGAAPFAGSPLEAPPSTTPYDQGEFAGVDQAIAQQKEISAGSDPEALQAEGARLLAEENSPGFFDAVGDAASAGVGFLRSLVSPNPSTAQGKQAARASGTFTKYQQSKDWRVRVSLAPQSNYLYNASKPGILAPLKQTSGVIFPYTPSIQVGYSAAYDSVELTHSNYKSQTYRSSSVDQVTITGDFTAQDTTEANYLLAVIHFFKSATKMFYGKDASPVRGTPPPLVYLSGYGAYQFDNHPMAITNFTYTLPTDVDYISASITTDSVGVTSLASLLPNATPEAQQRENPFYAFKSAAQRLLSSGLNPGGAAPAPVFLSSGNISDATRVPTRISLSITCLPIITRYNMSNQFSLQKYATGQLLRGSKNPNNGGGVW